MDSEVGKLISKSRGSITKIKRLLFEKKKRKEVNGGFFRPLTHTSHIVFQQIAFPLLDVFGKFIQWLLFEGPGSLGPRDKALIGQRVLKG